MREGLLQTRIDALTTKDKAKDLIWTCKELTQDHTYNLQKIEMLERDDDDLKRLLDKTKDDVKYYQHKWESDRSYTREYRSMEETVDLLKLENDSLRQQLPDSKCEQEQAEKCIQELERRLGSTTEGKDVYLRDLKDLRRESTAAGEYQS